jgi:hypothetical protein
MPVKVTGPRDKRKDLGDCTLVYTVSRASGWSRGLSPFFCGPVKLYAGQVATNVENAWQFSKVYKQHTDAQGNPTNEYFEWAKAGWTDNKAHRYPMGKGAKPEYAWWDGEKLGYLEARKRIYVPLYARAVRKTDAYKKLRELYDTGELIYLWDFDGYDHEALGMTMEDVLNNEKRPMGHAFVLKRMLDKGVK